MSSVKGDAIDAVSSITGDAIDESPGEILKMVTVTFCAPSASDETNIHSRVNTGRAHMDLK